MSRVQMNRSAPTRRWVLVLGLSLVATLLIAGCGDEAPDSSGSALAERWLRVGQDQSVNVQVFERQLPPSLVDLLNPLRTTDTPASDLTAFPVHPDGGLLGSYVMRRIDGEQVVWLFYDVAGQTLPEVTATVTGQLDESPWQVTAQRGNRSFTVVRFEDSRSVDALGNTFIEVAPPADSFTLTVFRDEAEVTLDIPRAAAAPSIEADLRDNLEVRTAYPGIARSAGLRAGDRIVRIGDVAVATRTELQRAREAMAAEAPVIAIIYAIQFTSPGAVTAPFVLPASIGLPTRFPAPGAWADLIVDEYESVVDAQGSFFVASLFSEERPSAVADHVRRGLEADGWTIVADDAVGLATQIQFERTDQRLAGLVQIDEAVGDSSLTQAFVQIQTSGLGGN